MSYDCERNHVAVVQPRLPCGRIAVDAVRNAAPVFQLEPKPADEPVSAREIVQPEKFVENRYMGNAVGNALRVTLLRSRNADNLLIQIEPRAAGRAAAAAERTFR